MKKIMLTALSLVAMATAQAQINLGKMAGAASKGVQALSFSNAELRSYLKNPWTGWILTIKWQMQIVLILSALTDFLANTKTKTV